MQVHEADHHLAVLGMVDMYRRIGQGFSEALREARYDQASHQSQASKTRNSLAVNLVRISDHLPTI